MASPQGSGRANASGHTFGRHLQAALDSESWIHPCSGVRASTRGFTWTCSMSITAGQRSVRSRVASGWNRCGELTWCFQMNDTVLVRGNGVAAACCVRSLSACGLPVSVVRAGRPKLSAVLLDEATQSLLTDLFMDKMLFAGLPRIRKRVVALGRVRSPSCCHTPRSSSRNTISSSAFGLECRSQSKRIKIRKTRIRPPGRLSLRGWNILGRDERRFGSRSAFVSNVQLKTAADRESCWAESLDDGWLFLFRFAGRIGLPDFSGRTCSIADCRKPSHCGSA
jgi:hypothetical protein